MTKLAYKIIGQGPELVFLHGWGMHSEIWQPVLPRLAAHYRLTLIDLPGHGRSCGVAVDSFDEVVDRLLEVVPDRAGWIGWSLGGQVAMRFGLLRSERVSNLMLVSSNPCFVQKKHWPNAMRSDLLQQFAEELQQDWRGTIQRFIALQFIGTRVPPKTLRALQQLVTSLPADPVALQRGLHWLQTVDLSTNITDLDMPLKFLLGRLDRLVPAQLANTLAGMGIEVEIMGEAGHAPFISHPEVFCEVLTQFFDEGDDVRSGSSQHPSFV